MNSRSPDRGRASFVYRSLDILEEEFPAAYLRMCSVIGPSRVLVVIDGDSTPLTFERNRVRRGPSGEPYAVTLRTTRQCILALLDARWTLVDAVLSDALYMQGTTDELLRLHDGLLVYLRGAIRCPSFPALLTSFR